MSLQRLLIANRGEIAIRIARAAADAGMRCVAVFSEDDADALHVQRADAAVALRGAGPAAYLDVAGLVAAAREAQCDALHPGYGFRSEDPALARACADAGVVFVGPSPETLTLFGDKTAARRFAAQCGVPVLRGGETATSLEAARAFLAAHGTLVLKAVSGGGGRGMRVVADPAALDAAFARCASEAQAAFGASDLYVEQWVPRARHVEVQVLGDAHGGVVHLHERDCSLQRRHQKLVEVAPAPGLDPGLRALLFEAALAMARASQYRGAGTFEFLVDADAFWFIEANARLQVEHTVTEELLGVDLVAAQLAIAGGASLEEIALVQARIPAPRGFAIQARVNAETFAADGTVRPSGGVLATFETPSGPGVRVDTAGAAGQRPNPRFDSLLAKVIARSPSGSFADAATRLARALGELHSDGVATNAPFLRRLLEDPDVVAWRVSTRYVDERAGALVQGLAQTQADMPDAARAGARVDARDPLAVLAHGKSGITTPAAVRDAEAAPPGFTWVRAPMQGTVVAVEARLGDLIAAGAPLVVMEAMKMEHVIAAPVSGRVERVAVAIGDAVYESHPFVLLEERAVADAGGSAGMQHAKLGAVRPDLAEVQRRQALLLDAARPEAVERRRKTRQRTARENVADLCDPGSFVEYGGLAIAAQRRRRPVSELIERTQADGLVAGIGRVNGDRFGERASQCVVLAYDYTVMAGTQGLQNHRKKDRMFELAAELRLPVVFFTEGGGGRPGDTDSSSAAGLDCWAFHDFGRLSGLVPLVGINSGRCFAGNAALLGCCDVVIATANSSIGMGGPAMIEGGGLGVFHPDEVGPMSVQTANGVVDVAVEDEAEAVRVAKQYLAYFQGPLAEWSCADQTLLRDVVPENRLRVYAVRRAIEGLADTGSVLELRRGFGAGMVTALARVEGRPLGIVANDPMHLAGAIDSDGADKATRFLQVCDAFDLPVLFLCDTPGMMVGPEVEKTALVRHCARLFVTGANLSVPFFTIILRKGYGLGAQAMAGGSFKAPLFTVAWPTGEFGGMGLEGAVKLGFRKELAALEDPAQRRALFDKMVAAAYEQGKALSFATYFEIDDVIDPADSRARIVAALRAAPPPAPRAGKKRRNIDTW
jgi:acetyl/propionyl-CoA carboxylase alpha subunit/acetyl-CoA carboxylase carboxyltransferase component